MSTILDRINQLKVQKEAINNEIKTLQDGCDHLRVTGKYDGNTGNWCKDDDCYWWEGACLDCGKHLHVDSEDPNYRLYASRVVEK